MKNILPEMQMTPYLKSCIEESGLMSIMYDGYQWSFNSKYVLGSQTEIELDKLVIAHLSKH